MLRGNDIVNKLTAILASLLVIVIGFNGFFYWQQGQELDEALSQVDTLSGQVVSLESTTSALADGIADIGGSIASFDRDIVFLTAEVAGLGMTGASPASVIPLVAPAVVRIEVDSPPNRTPGSGIIITQSGYVITNSHVIEGNASVSVTLPEGQTYTAAVVGDDPELDLAILEIDSGRTDFPVAVFGSNEDITVGEKVLALGYPYSDDLGGELSAVDGIVSSLRFIEGYDYIQSDVEISLGYGGGPLVNLDGEVIGMITWTFTAGEGLKFAIPVNNIMDFINDTIGAI
jgi:S1-C subfamily serine protease